MPRQRRIGPGGTRGTVFKEVSRIRLADAAALMSHGRYSGAIYMAGYAVECLLKWAVTRRKELLYLPAELETHDWDMLVHAAGLEKGLSADPSISGVYTGLAERWAPELRYLAAVVTPRLAQQLYRDIHILYDWIVEQAL